MMDAGGVTTSPRPAERPAVIAAPPAPQLVTSQASLALASYYKRLENDALVRGLLRTDGGGVDTPFTDRMLTDNFMAIALRTEFEVSGGAVRQTSAAAPLQRWSAPVDISVTYGNSVTDAQRALIGREVLSYTKRLTRASGHPVRTTSGGGNFQVFVLSEDERPGFAERLPQILPGAGSAWQSTIRNLPRNDLCLVVTFGRANTYTRAIAVIRQELPDLLLRSCLHEEIAQGLGLGNDSPRARPSIFNDDEEFALLTTHDEALLRILYDPRLRRGMTERTARPIVAQIATEVVGQTTTTVAGGPVILGGPV